MFTPEESAKIQAIQEQLERVCPSVDPHAVEQAITPYEEIRRRMSNAQFEALYFGRFDGKKPPMPPPGMPPKGKGKPKPKGKGKKMPY